MSELSTTIVEGYHSTGDGLDLIGTDFWGFALDQRAFGPRHLVVVKSRGDGRSRLAHCEFAQLPDLALKCCLAALDDRAAAAVAYNDEPESADPPIGLRHRLDTAGVAAREFGVHLVDWITCDHIQVQARLNLTNDNSHNMPTECEPHPRRNANTNQIAFAGLLTIFPIRLPIPRTATPAHLEDNIAAAALQLEQDERDHRGGMNAAARHSSHLSVTCPVARVPSGTTCTSTVVVLLRSPPSR
jgi:hypothetical protein